MLGYIPQELEATIAWNFPTIEALARYCTDAVYGVSTPTKPSEPTMSEIQNLTETQLQDSIDQEIAELENWLQTR